MRPSNNVMVTVWQQYVCVWPLAVCINELVACVYYYVANWWRENRHEGNRARPNNDNNLHRPTLMAERVCVAGRQPSLQPGLGSGGGQAGRGRAGLL